MTTLSAGLDAALSADLATPFFAVELAFSAATVRLLDGSGTLSFGGRTFVGFDQIYGVLGGGTAITDGVDGEAPTATIILLPPTNTATATLAAPSAQGAVVSCWIGAVSPVTGQVLGEPDLRFVGDVDVPTLRVGETRALELACVSAWERFFADNEGVRLSDAWHQSVWPAETGLSGVTTVLKDLPWGSDGPVPNAATAAGGGGTPSVMSGGLLTVAP